MLLENRVALVYGAGGSIGGAVARAFAREGARVFLAGRTAAALDDVADEIRVNGAESCDPRRHAISGGLRVGRETKPPPARRRQGPSSRWAAPRRVKMVEIEANTSSSASATERRSTTACVCVNAYGTFPERDGAELRRLACVDGINYLKSYRPTARWLVKKQP